MEKKSRISIRLSQKEYEGVVNKVGVLVEVIGLRGNPRSPERKREREECTVRKATFKTARSPKKGMGG